MFLKDYEADLVRRRVSPDTLAGFRATAKTWPYGDHPAREEIYEWLGAHTWAPRTQRIHVKHMHAAWEHQIELRRIEHNPFHKVKTEGIKHSEPRVTNLVPELERRCPDDQWALWLRMYTHTGMRLSEAIQVDVNDVDGDFIRLPSEKAKGGKARSIPIHPQLRLLMNTHHGSTHYINYKGRPMSRRGSIGRMLRLRGDDDVKMHDLRRTFATTLLACGGSRDYIEMMIGHGRGDLWELYTRALDPFLYETVLKLQYV